VCSTTGSEPVRYVTLEETILPQGELSVSVPARAEAGGRAGNTQSGTVTVMVTSPPSMESVTNSAAFTGGEDSESDGELRGRLMQSYSGVSNGTNASFYREFALQYDGVHSVGVVPRESGAGTVGVYLGGRGTVPSDDMVAQVRAGLGKVREINVSVHVAAAQIVPVNVEVSVVPAKNVTNEEAVAAADQAVLDYFSRLAVGEPVIVAAMGAAILATGTAVNYNFTSSVITDRTMSANQLAVCGNRSILFSGGAG
jgi:Uncharacterized homolog of phage Mu protein gp47